MPTKDSYAHGVPNWIDLSTTDVEGAKSFYGSLFGWDFVEESADDHVYHRATKGGGDVAGLAAQAPEQAQQGVPPMWNSYINVDDVEAATAEVEGAGGQVMMPPMDVVDAGRMSVIVDPTGAVICLWEKRNHIGATVVNEHGAHSWNELLSDDVSAAAEFYGQVVGWTREDMDMGDQGTYTLFEAGGDQIAGAMAPPMEGVPNHWGIYFAVDDVAASAAEVVELGGQQLSELIPSPAGTLAACADPQGASFSIIQPAEM